VQHLGQRAVAATQVEHRLFGLNPDQLLVDPRLRLRPAVGEGFRQALVEFAIELQ